jgi:histidine triad (HIT) family protein
MASIFTKIINGEIKGTVVYQDDQCAVLLDIQPQAPKHFLVIPKKEIRSVADASPQDEQILGHLLLVAAKVARDHGISDDGYRLVINTNVAGGQTVWHLHVHLLGGRQMAWPPG